MPAPNPPISGLEISPVYEKLGSYISRRYSRSNDVYRLVVLSLAYSFYCRKKKEQIVINMNLNHGDWKHSTVVKAYTQFSNDAFYDECCKNAEVAIKTLSEEFLLQRIRQMFAKNPIFYVLEQSVFNFLAVALASLSTLILISIVAVAKSGSLKQTAHDFGSFIISIGESIQRTF